MARYVRKPQTVEARFWDGSTLIAEKLCVWITRASSVATFFYRCDAADHVLSITIDTPDHAPIVVSPNHYLCWTDTSDFIVLSRDEFEKTYAKITAHQTMG